jgi:hypothetical protein
MLVSAAQKLRTVSHFWAKLQHNSKIQSGEEL